MVNRSNDGGKKMKRLFKKMIPIVALLMLCTTVLTCMSGCLGKDDSRFDTDLFCCKYNEDKTGVIILSLTQKGQEQEILVIPEEINGLPVVQLGGETTGYPYTQNHIFKSEKLKKLYICSEYLTSYENLPNLKEVLIINENAFASLALGIGDSTLNHCSNEITVFTTEEIFDKYQSYFENAYISRSYKKANIIFYRQANKEFSICWIDDTSTNFRKILPTSINSIYIDENFTELWDEEFDGDSNKYYQLYIK